MVHDFTVRLVAVAVGLLAMLPAAPAAAGPEEAREYFSEAKRAYSQGEYERAADLLEKAYSEEANLTYQYNRIRALQGAEKYERALDVLETYEQPMLDAEGFEDIPKIKRELKEELEETSGTEAGRDDRKEGAADDEGADDELEPTEKDRTAPATDETDAGTSGPSPMVGWSLVGGGGALLTTGILFSTTVLLPESVRSQVREADGGNVQFESKSDFQTFMTHRSLAIGFITVGALATGAGTFFLLKNRGNQSNRAGRSPRIDVAPTLSTDRVGARLKVAF